MSAFLLYKRWRFPEDESVSVNNVLMRNLGFTGEDKRRALKELEGLRLIKPMGVDGIVSAVELLQI
jgi:hypothetical protein